MDSDPSTTAIDPAEIGADFAVGGIGGAVGSTFSAFRASSSTATMLDDRLAAQTGKEVTNAGRNRRRTMRAIDDRQRLTETFEIVVGLEITNVSAPVAQERIKEPPPE